MNFPLLYTHNIICQDVNQYHIRDGNYGMNAEHACGCVFLRTHLLTLLSLMDGRRKSPYLEATYKKNHRHPEFDIILTKILLVLEVMLSLFKLNMMSLIVPKHHVFFLRKCQSSALLVSLYNHTMTPNPNFS